MKRNILAVVLVLLALGGAATPLTAQDFPKPDNWVADTAGVMDAESYQKTVSLIAELERKTSAEIAVVTVKSLGDRSVEEFAVGLFEAWGIGKKGKDNGVLVLAAMDERRARIEVGYGLEPILPDGKTGEILDRFLIPEFQAGKFGRGMYLATLAVATVIAKDAGVQLAGETLPVQPARKPTILGTAFNVLVLLVLFIFFIRHPFLFLLFFGFGGRRGGRGPFGGGGGFGGGGFGGFGGGRSGGGGASRGW